MNITICGHWQLIPDADPDSCGRLDGLIFRSKRE